MSTRRMHMDCTETECLLGDASPCIGLTPPPASSPGRAYCIGLPVIVTISDDGTIEYEIDKSEVESGIAEEWNENEEMQAGWDESRMLLDSAIVGATFRDDQQMQCPVRWRCGFLSPNLDEMMDHIVTGTHGSV